MMFQTPGILLSAILGSIPAALFQIWRGRSALDLLIYEAAGLLGFAAGQVAAVAAGLQFLTIGQVHPLEGLAGSVAALFLAHWLRKP
ncbi:MAG: hypothetical protein GX605_00565 [Chloroflexi bacterium]|nr:hypothetical protein [Chloroflexota bacterium]